VVGLYAALDLINVRRDCFSLNFKWHKAYVLMQR